jgi:PAS domain S-box-containing protein
MSDDSIHDRHDDPRTRASAGESHRLLTLLLNAVKQAIIATDVAGNVLYWNRFAETLYGWSAAEVLGKDITRVLLPDDPERARAAMRNPQPQTAIATEWALRRKDGSRVVVSAAATPIHDEAGALVGIVGVSWDIAEQKRLEQELHRSESRVKLFVQQLPALAWATDAQLNVVWSLGGTFRPLARWPAAEEAHRRALRGESAVYETEDEGVVRQAVVEPFRDPQGHITGTIGVAFDVTQRKRAEEALRMSERRLAEAQQIGHVGSWEMNLVTRTLVMSDEFLRILGRDDEGLAPTPDTFVDCVHPDDRASFIARTAPFNREGAVYRDAEYRIVRPDGTVRFVHGVGEIVHDDSGRPLRVVGSLRDVTDQRRAQQEIARRIECQKAIAELGLAALRSVELSPLLAEIAAVTRKTLAVDYCSVLEALPDDTLVVCAWSGGAVDQLGFRLAPGVRSHSHFARIAKEPVVTEDFERETRFDVHPKLRELGVVSGAATPIHGRDRVYGILGVHSTERRSYSQDDRNFLQSVANIAGSAMERHAVDAELRAHREQLQALSRRLMEAQEAERRALARELHDDFGQFLTALRLNLQAASGASPRDRAHGLADAITLVDQGIDQVRSLALDLRPALLDDLGLLAALRSLVKRQAKRGGFRATLRGDPIIGRLPAEIETCSFRVVQEALTNVARHAAAREVDVEIVVDGHEVRIVVHDDGSGFDVAAARRRSAAGASLGLASMNERVTLVGGRFAIDSCPKSGTTVRATIPVTRGGTAP